MYNKIDRDVRKWLPANVQPEFVEKVSLQVVFERQERVLKNPNSYIDYGYSFPGVNLTKQLCLESVREFYTTQGIRPVVADLGAGFGTMTWKLLAAGAQVDAFEKQVPTAKELQKRLNSMDKELWSGEDLEDILRVYAKNALSELENPEFENRYDVIWVSQMLHFLTPGEMNQLIQQFQKILKPGGMIFIEMNSPETFQSLDPLKLIEHSVENAKKLKFEYPGFVCVNAATLINRNTSQIDGKMVVSVFDQEQMVEKSIPIEGNAYGLGYIGHPDSHDNEQYLDQFMKPGYQYSVNRFYQTANWFDDEIALDVFEKAGFETACYYYGSDGQKYYTKSTLNDNDAFALSIFLKKSSQLELDEKPKELSVVLKYGIFKANHHEYLLVEAKQFCRDDAQYESLLKAIENKDYALALRKASAGACLPLVRLLLKFSKKLAFDINQPSPSNGWTALDWISNTDDRNVPNKKEIIGILERYGALTNDALQSLSTTSETL
ncbi:hypothetical protein DGG96_02040 [Legionella qingyii]|uniref:Class I SAM-dependent methyltransferase n=1 Tax=Legionella qingyii TaxID=2184757 RepID=A0A317U536_9GAMM|nr:class I SAM-dependent methyltransferase [Legionella qingyii]PWY56529.1 hypothetical protein DGG96_07150 [Legionella qingyii]PWY57114.1 hypothetical protein DGG96_02040 [Legionella qingyii]RUR25046.1 class I SAM-dependent methyltransferase [Legionella qingyii]